jgi:hypothetical protein
VLTGRKRASSAGRSHPTGSVPSSSSTISRASNVQQVKNAVNNVCLAGSHHDAARQEALQLLDDCVSHGVPHPTIDRRLPVSQFVILLFQSKSLAFRGIYATSPLMEDYLRVYGRGPKTLPRDLIVEAYMKYSSSSRSFVSIPTKSLTSTTDAISIDPTKVKKQIQNIT